MDALPQPRDDYGLTDPPDGGAVEDPLVQLRQWLDEAIAAEVPEPTAATVATVDHAGRPDARIVLLRGADERGVWWFTNLGSAKGVQLAARPVAAVVVHWVALERQVRLRGPVEVLAATEADVYFAGRPRASQLAAWASDQSAPLTDRASLDAAVARVERRFAGQPVPRPAHWGGQLLRPTSLEFWQGRAARLHDRLRYTRVQGAWRRERLQP